MSDQTTKTDQTKDKTDEVEVEKDQSAEIEEMAKQIEAQIHQQDSDKIELTINYLIVGVALLFGAVILLGVMVSSQFGWLPWG